jgi:hypothetical protein
MEDEFVPIVEIEWVPFLLYSEVPGSDLDPNTDYFH